MNRPTRTLRRIGLTTALAAGAFGAAAPSALGADGEGLLGRPTDFEITMWGFAVIALFILLPIVLSLIQHRLETRKERAREQLDRVRRP